ncbi:hypothetical protein D9M72_547630 [compost metagenome]
MSAARVGTENEMFLGTISPMTTCRKVTSNSAATKAMIPIASPESEVRPRGISSRWWMAGSETFRITSEHTVMPSWLVASISVACSMAHSVVFAALLPASALGSICDRRAEMTANSAPTKKALTTRSTTSQMMPGRYSLMGQLRGQGIDDAVMRALGCFL